MPKMDVRVPHQLTQEEAASRIRNLIGELKQKFGGRIHNLQETWSGSGGTFSFETMGFNLSGTLSVGASEVRIEGSLPLAALPFRGMVEEAILEKAKNLLSNS